MTKSLTIALSVILLVSLGIFSGVQVKKLNTAKSTLTTKIKKLNDLEDSLNIEKEERIFLSEFNIELEDENQILRDSITKLHRVIARLHKKINSQGAIINELQGKLEYLEKEYAAKKEQIAIMSRKEVVDTKAIATIELEKATIKTQMNDLQTEQSQVESLKLQTEIEVQDKIESEERFRKIVNVVNNTRIKFQDIKIKAEPAGQPVSRLIAEGKNWKFTNIEFYMNHSDTKMLLDEQFLVKILDMDFQEELAFTETNPLSPKGGEIIRGATFFFDGNLVEINHNNDELKKGKNYEIQIYFKSSDGEEYLLLDGVKQFIREGNIIEI